MPRKLRLEFPGAMYHVMSRGDHREDIFLCDVDRYGFMETLAEACRKSGWQVHRRGPTLSIRQIAERLHLGKPKGGKTNLHKRLHHAAPTNSEFQFGI